MSESFNPPAQPLEDLAKQTHGLLPLAGRANAALARYDGRLQALINPNVMLSSLIVREAVLSSKIEGTVTNAADVYEHDAGQEALDIYVYGDVREVINYRRALIMATEIVAEDGMSLHLVRSLHGVLMDNVRGSDQNPGAFRTTQNWVGRKGCKIEDALYVPPNPMKMLDHLENFEQLLQIEDVELDPIIQVAITHAHFELIHPFDDGNGRVGRLLIPLQLCRRGTLVSPSFYISEYFEKNEGQYKDRLAALSINGEWAEWINFFLEAVIEQANNNRAQIDQLTELHDSLKGLVASATKSTKAYTIVDVLFKRPIFNSRQFAEDAGMGMPAVHKAIAALKEAGIISVRRPSSGRRPAVLEVGSIMDLIA